MIEGADVAEREIRSVAIKNITWFAPPDDRRFDPISIATVLAGLLLTSFLAGFEAEAKKKGEEIGGAAFRYLWKGITDMFDDTKTNTGKEKEQVEKHAEEAPRTAKALSDEEFTLHVRRTREKLVIELKTKLPAERADALAQSVIDSALEHVLGRPGKK